MTIAVLPVVLLCGTLLGRWTETDVLLNGGLRGSNLEGANLAGKDLHGANLRGAHYDPTTRWPVGFDPRPRGAVLVATSTAGGSALR
jgi:uncharacterized protein YjbI with pentapeptide repeats